MGAYTRTIFAVTNWEEQVKYIYGQKLKTFRTRVTTVIASAAILANSFGIALPFLLTGRAVAATNYSNGFETDTTNWIDFGGTITRVASGTNGIASANGSYHAEINGSVYTQWGGYESTFPSNGYSTEISVYLDTAHADGTDKRIDFSSAINTPAGNHRRDFIFSLGTGAVGTWVVSASNNAPGWPGNPARSPITLTSTGWYTLGYEFANNGSGVLEVTMTIKNAGGSTLGSWVLSDPSDVIGTTVGGHRYGWFIQQQPAAQNYYAYHSLAIDDASLVTAPLPPTVQPCVSPSSVLTTDLSTWDLSETRATGHNELVSSGLRVWTEGATSTDKAAGYYATDFPLSGLGDQTIADALDYDASFGIEPGLQLDVDFDNDSSVDGILVGESVYGNDWWLTNSAAQFVKDNAPNTGGGYGTPWHGTPNEWLTSFPSAQVKAIGYSLGSGVYADGVIEKISLGCVEYTFSVEPTTVIVTGDTSAGENQPGWLFNRDFTTSTDYEFTSDEASIGSGSVYAGPITNSNYSGTPGNNPNWDKFVAENFIGTTMGNVDSISYDFKIGSGGDASKKDHYYMNVYANFASSSPTKFYDCRYNILPSSGSTSNWTTVTFDPTQNYSVTTRTGGDPSPQACPSSPAAMGDDAYIRVFSLNLGDTSANDTGLDGYFDNVVVQTTNAITVYDFEPDTTAPAVPTGLHRVAEDDGEVLACGVTTDRQTLFPTWDANTEPDFSHYEYTSYNPGGVIGINEQVLNTNQFVHNWTPPTDGTNGFKVRSVDVNGNKSAWTDICYITYDSTAPTMPVHLSPPDNSAQNINDFYFDWTDSVDASDITYEFQSSQSPSVDSNGALNSGVWNNILHGAPDRNNLTESEIHSYGANGTWYWQVRAIDEAGNKSAWTSPWKLTIDMAAPDAPVLLSPGNGVPINGSNPVANDWQDVLDASYYIYQSYNVDGSGNCNLASIRWTEDYTASQTNSRVLADGLKFCWRVKAVDAAGNQSAWSELWKTIADNSAPSVPVITNPTAEQYFNSTPILNKWAASSDANGVAGYQIAYRYDDGHTFGGSTCPGELIDGLPVSGCRDTSATQRNHIPGLIEQGGVTIWVRAVDNAGNWSDWSDSVHYYYDATPPAAPTITVSESGGDVLISGDLTNSYSIITSWPAVDGASGYEYRYYNSIPGNAYNAPNYYQVQTTGTSLAGVFNQGEGLHHLQVRAVDAAGNWSGWSSVFDVIYDATAPSLTIDPLTDSTDTTPTITGTVNDPNASVFVSVNGGTPEPATNNGDDTWTFQVVTPLSVGAHTFTASATDLAGNSTTPEPTENYTVTSGVVAGVSTNTPNSNNSGNAGGNPSPTAFQNAAARGNQGGNTGTVLAAETDEPSEDDLNRDEAASELDEARTLATGDEKSEENADEANGCSKILGLCWYWWIPIVVVILGTVYYFSSRRADEK